MTHLTASRMGAVSTVRVLLALATVAAAAPAAASELAGSITSMRRQHGVAVEGALGFARTAGDVRARVERGELVPVPGNEDYELSAVSQPYARPEVRSFVERLGAEYRAATGSRLVVTSLTRPASSQPANAHRLSVHPAGMAVDFRVPGDAEARTWLERTLVGHERAGRLDVTRERRPPHYHVALFPTQWAAYVDSLAASAQAVRDSALAAARDSAAAATPAVATATMTPPESATSLGRLGGGLAAAALGITLAVAGRRRTTTR